MEVLTHWASPNLLPEMPRYCCLLEILLAYSFIEILLKFRTVYLDHQAGKSARKCLCQDTTEWCK